ncbi:nucleotide exchange factor GrpE [Acidobacteriota bacterium]
MADSLNNNRNKDSSNSSSQQKHDASTDKQDRPHMPVHDRRFWVRAQEGDESEAEETERSPYPSFVEELNARTEAAENKLKERLSELDEEFKELKTRLDKDVEHRVLSEKAAFIQALLPLQDDLDRALEAAGSGGEVDTLVDGLELIGQKFQQALARIGCEKIEVAGRKFDPNVSEAAGVLPTGDPDLDGVVMKEIRSGYKIGERLVQPARVIVGRYE